MSKSKIEWTDETWNPVTGCSKVSQGCKHCYAKREWVRLVHLPRYKGRNFTDIACHEDRLLLPLSWKKPRKVFVDAMSDLFHPDVPNSFIAQVFGVMAATPEHTYQVLTKRPERMRKLLDDPGFADLVDHLMHGHTHADADWPLPNVHLGVSIEDQPTADARIVELIKTPAAVHWVSGEPLLGRIDLTAIRHGNDEDLPVLGTQWGLDWVVVGGESGPHARPMHPQWARDLRDQCAAAGVPFFVKQLSGERGKVIKDISAFPEDLRIQEYPR